MTILLGCIADDFTGATDLAGMLVKGGMRTVQTIGVPQEQVEKDADAVVVALKSRTVPAAEAVAESLAALAWLRAQGARQFFFKYCSTFDSTPHGNIGPVAEALMAALATDFAIFCPAFPENGRTICRGYLFVGDMLLNESGMQNHPLTPMTDANLVRVLQGQAKGKVGLVRYDTVAQGPRAIAARFATLKGEGVALAVVDALNEADLHAIGAACAGHKLVTGGSGVALGLPVNFANAGLLREPRQAGHMQALAGGAIVLSGSCSAATNNQVAHWRQGGGSARQLDPLSLVRSGDALARTLDWVSGELGAGRTPLVYATAQPQAVKAAQHTLGVERAGQVVESALAEVARLAQKHGVRKFVVAGGETSGAVVQALGVSALRIGPTIDPGVPWTQSTGAGERLALALKSGNFGSADFFAKALAMAEAW